MSPSIIIYIVVVTTYTIWLTFKIVAERIASRERVDELIARIKDLDRGCAANYDNLRAARAESRAHQLQEEALRAELSHMREANREHIVDLGAKLKEARTELGNRLKMSGIKFTANVPNQGWTKTDFKLGKGPCGLTVEALACLEMPDRFVITQWCEGGERKEFTYFKSDIVGRIEYTYRAPTDTSDSL